VHDSAPSVLQHLPLTDPELDEATDLLPRVFDNKPEELGKANAITPQVPVEAIEHDAAAYEESGVQDNIGVWIVAQYQNLSNWYCQTVKASRWMVLRLIPEGRAVLLS